MENLKQAFVDYASSRNNGVWGRKDEKSSDIENGTCKNETNVGEEEEWIEYVQPLDLVDVHNESVYESLIKKMPSCSLNFDSRIEKGNPNNLKIPCMIGRNMSYVMDFIVLENVEANIDPSLSQVVFGKPFVETTRIILSDDDVRRGCEGAWDLKSGFSNGVEKLGRLYRRDIERLDLEISIRRW
nr:hypothetical protein [Tanacetum cinerariifolium]